MKTPIIFLDIDDVLNNTTDYIKAAERDAAGDFPWFNRAMLCGGNPVEKHNVQAFNRIIHAFPDALVVITSAWRIVYDLESIQEYLDCFGFEGEIIDRTGRCGMSGSRNTEIGDWIRENDVERFVIIDDMKVAGANRESNFVWVTGARGLTNDMADNAIKILS